MSYQIRRTKKFTDTLELCGESGAVEKSLEIEIDLDAVSGGYRKTLAALADAEQALKKAQAENNIEAFDGAYIAYGNAIIALFELTLGKGNTEEILTFYESRYTEMALQLVPYISNVIIPLVSDVIKQKKREMKQINRRRR